MTDLTWNELNLLGDTDTLALRDRAWAEIVRLRAEHERLLAERVPRRRCAGASAGCPLRLRRRTQAHGLHPVTAPGFGPRIDSPEPAGESASEPRSAGSVALRGQHGATAGEVHQ